MRALFLIIGLSVFGGFAQSDSYELGTIKLFKDLIEIKIPTSFTVLHDYEVKKLYPHENLPRVVYGNEDRSIRIALDSEENGVKTEQLDNFLSVFGAAFEKLHGKLKWKTNELVDVNGKNVGCLEFVAKEPIKKYVYFFFTNFKGQLLSCTIEHPKKKYKKWMPISEEILQSLKISE